MTFDVAWKWKHKRCGGDITPEERVVFSQPNDRAWPKDVSVQVAHCDRCKQVVPLNELEAVVEGG